MKIILFLFIFFPLFSMDHSHHPPTPEELESALNNIAELKKAKSCCRLTKPRVAAITSIVSSAIAAGVTLATVYTKCDKQS